MVLRYTGTYLVNVYSDVKVQEKNPSTYNYRKRANYKSITKKSKKYSRPKPAVLKHQFTVTLKLFSFFTFPHILNYCCLKHQVNRHKRFL